MSWESTNDSMENNAVPMEEAGYPGEPFRLRLNDITPGRPWPPNLQELMRNPTGVPSPLAATVERKITITEVTALLCHAALIEVGFVPENSNASPLDICKMSDAERIHQFGKQVNSSGYNSTASVFAWTYQVVNFNATDIDIDKSGDTATEKKIIMEEVAMDVDPKAKSEELNVNINDTCNYQLSPPCSIILIPKGSKTQIFCNFPGASTIGLKPFQLVKEVELRARPNIKVLDHADVIAADLETLRLTPDEWMDTWNFDGRQFSWRFKSDFANFCLDAMNGVMLDFRGLISLPPEILFRIFAYTDLHSIRNIRLTCHYLNDVLKIPGLLESLRKKESETPRSVQPTRRSRFFYPRFPYHLSSHYYSTPQDYRAIYDSYRRNNFDGPRFDIVGGPRRLLGRTSWFPYDIPPSPYFFRLTYDLSK